jgi:hypothetical protein
MSNRRRFVRVALAFALVAASSVVTGCGGGGATTPTPVLCDPNDSSNCTAYSQYCPYPNGFTPQMLFPIPNSTSVPNDISGIAVADYSGVAWTGNNFYYQFYLSNLSQAFAVASIGGVDDKITSGVQLVTVSQVPAPSAPASLPNPEYLYGSILNGPLAPSTQFYVYVDEDAQSGSNEFCAPTGPIGSFTTAAAPPTASVRSYSHPAMPARELLRLRS